MKIDMYEKVPESFHSQLLETLDQLPEEEKRESGKHHKTKRKFTSRKWMVLAAAAVLAMGTMTVVATEIFKWNDRAKERFGVTDDLEDELTMDGVTRQENTLVQSQGLEFRLLQSVRTDESCYYLCQMTLPEGIVPDDDTIFENIDAEADVELNGLVVDVVRDSQSGNQMLVEIEILLADGIDYEGQEVMVHMSNLVQTRKTEITGTLLEGDWEVPVTLLGETEEVVYEVDQRVMFGEHELLVQKVKAGPFHIRLYMEKDEAQHALMFYPVELTGIRNRDGSLTGEGSYVNRFGRTDEASEEFYYEATLEQAIDQEEISGLVFNDGEVEIALLPEMGKTVDGAAGDSSGADDDSMAPEEETYRTDVNVSDTELPENVQTLYQRYGNAIVMDGNWLYIHDITCGRMVRVLDLSELDFDQEKGGEIVPFSTTMAYILPYEGCDTVYIYGLVRDENGEHILSAMPAKETLESDSYQMYREYMLEVRDGVTKE